MTKRILLTAFLALVMTAGMLAQRTTDVLDRGLVAVKTNSGIFCSWRIFGEEYYDVAYNIYRDNVKLNTTPLSVSNYTDASGTASSKYTVAPVVRGIEKSQCAAVSPWSNNYLQVNLGKVYSNNGGADITSQYEPNDVSVADLDGDGIAELLVKRKNTTDAANLFSDDDKNFDVLEAYKLDGTRLWWIDCGPNMVSGSSVEVNIVAYDWDGDGKAEVLLRGADGMVIHESDGTIKTIGDASVNTRNTVSHTANMTYTNTGAEYLLYLNGQTAQPYQVLDYPLTRGAAKDWGDDYGHRSSKYFFGAPFLDGRKPSIFLARGIYTRHKMIAYDVDAATHTLVKRWYWECLDSSSPWYGQGYHNYGIADVDWDGRDEIVYGSMVIDDNGKGLSTTGLGHGDAQHCSDFNPYVHGQEIFACNEDSPNNNYRDATTSQIYYRSTSGSDDGRSMMGNFSDEYPGAQGVTAHDGNLISSVTNKGIDGGTKNNIDENFRIYWDGDLLEETFNYSGWNSSNYSETGSPRVCKYGTGAIQSFDGALTCNGTKGTPSNQSDILGDWREELILRTTDNNLRIYTTTDPTEYRNYTLWHDMQYRNAMVWEMCGYNQPPHVSYFLGKTEGITMAPPPLTMTNRTEIANGGSISSAYNDKQIIMAETNDMSVSVADGASPYIFFDNAPTWVQGHDDNSNITTTTYTHTLTGGAFGGSMRLVKQGDGVLTLPSVTQKYTGNTDVWAGTVNFDGEMQSSRVWLNRFAILNTKGGKFDKGIEMNYAASLRPGGNDSKGTVTTDSLIMNYGSRAVLDVYGTDNSSDEIKTNVLKIEKKIWTNGPTYSTPVFQIVPHYASGATSLPAGQYLLAEVGKIVGDISDIVVEGVGSQKATLSYADGKIYLDVQGVRDATTVTWTGSDNTTWDLADIENFKTTATGEKNIFVSGDHVIFDDDAANATVNIVQSVAPANVTFSNSKQEYTLTGDSIIGSTDIDKSGSGNVVINNINTFTGTTNINAGKITVNTLANASGVQQGSLGKLANTINIDGGTLANNANITTSQPIILGVNDGTIEVPTNLGLVLTGSIKSNTRSNLYKTGAGSLTLPSTCSFKTMHINAGTVIASENSNSIHQYPDTVIINSGTMKDPDNMYSYSTSNVNVVVPDGKTGSWYLDGRCSYKGKLFGDGTLSVYATNSRIWMYGDWSAFTGTLNINSYKTGSYDPEFTLYNSYGLKKATVNAGCPINNNGNNFEFGNLTGTATLSGTGTYTIGALDRTVSYSGTLSGCKIIKVGSGVWTMSAIQSALGGDVTVKGGVLHLYNSNTTSEIFGSRQVYATDSGTVAGTALVYGINAQNGGTIAPGVYTTHRGTLSVSGNVYAYSNSNINLYIYNAKNTSASVSYLKVGGTLSINGAINITKSSFTPVAGDSISLWSAGSFTGKPTAVNLPDISSYGLAWDSSHLLQANGYLLVVSSTGITDINADAEVACTVFNTAGVIVGEFEGKKSDVRKNIGQLNLGKGTYIVRIHNALKNETIKIALH